MRRPAVIISATVCALILGVVAFAFAFGTPQAPTPITQSPAAAGSGSGIPAEGSQVPGTASGKAAPGAEVPPADPSSPLAIQIPGCVCHSDDPQVVEEHSTYRMNQCFGCHKEGTPAMGQ